MRNICTVVIFISIALSGCSVGKVSSKKNDGYFTSTKSAEILTNTPINLDTLKQLLIVPNNPFIKGMCKNIGYFEEVLTYEELEKEIIKANKHNDVGVLSGKIGLNNAFHKYKKFLYIEFKSNPDKKNRIQLRLTNPGNMEDLLVADTAYDLVWNGVNDQNTYNPLFNSLITYIKEHSETF